MTADGAVAPPVMYGIVKDPLVRAFLGTLDTSVRDALNEVFDALQFNPRPPGHQVTVSGGNTALQLVVGQSPRHLVLYRVDDAKEKVFVMFVSPTVFAGVESAAAIPSPGPAAAAPTIAAPPAAEPPEPVVFSDEQRVQLRRVMASTFSESDLRNLCFDLESELGVTYENLPGETPGDKVRELIVHCQRIGKLRELLIYCRGERPNAEWPAVAG